MKQSQPSRSRRKLSKSVGHQPSTSKLSESLPVSRLSKLRTVKAGSLATSALTSSDDQPNPEYGNSILDDDGRVYSLDELLCPICGHILEGAVETSCGHLFCANCVMEILESSSAGGQCRVCRSAITFIRPSLHYRKLVTQFIRDVKEQGDEDENSSGILLIFHSFCF